MRYSLAATSVALTLLWATPIYAEQQSATWAKLVDAITLCPAPDNPLDGLHSLKGNLFKNVHVQWEKGPKGPYPIVITVDAILSGHTSNRSIRAPDFRVGIIEIEMGYRRSGVGGMDDKPYCKLKIQKTRDWEK
jgi:hypothetical protein